MVLTVIQDNLLYLTPCSSDKDPLPILEFLHRVADAFEEFLGSPVLANKITSNYDIVAQIVAEMADGGIVCQGEANVLRDSVETGPGVLKNLLGGVGLPGTSPALAGGSGAFQRPMIHPPQSSQGSAIPWRRSNVRHTSNELYVDIVETLSVTLAPSGRPLAAFAYGSIAFTAKVSGVPDLLLSLSTGGKGAGMGSRGDQLRTVMERAVFHPCVRLNRWKADGVLSFIPPDGRFALCGYEADLLGPDAPLVIGNNTTTLDIPVTPDITTGLGSDGSEFEVRLVQPTSGSFGVRSAATASLQSNLGRSSALRPTASGDSKAPSLENLTIRIPIPAGVRNVPEMRSSRGEAHWLPADNIVEWKISSKEASLAGAVLRCAVQGIDVDRSPDEARNVPNGMTTSTYDYDEDQPALQQTSKDHSRAITEKSIEKEKKQSELYKTLMPSYVTISFDVKGWLASGLRVESLQVDAQKSKGMSAELRPYKGVKYLTVSRDGIEARC